MNAIRTAINQANAQHSTGPRTAEGKETSSRNSLRHGLTSTAVVLPHEDRGAYEKLKSELLRQHTPQTVVEEELIIGMANAWWRLQRAYRVESELFASRGSDEAILTLFTDAKESAKLRLVLRYLAAAERAWAKAQSDFEKARKQRVASFRTPETPALKPVPAPFILPDIADLSHANNPTRKLYVPDTKHPSATRALLW